MPAKTSKEDNMTIAVPQKERTDGGPRVQVYLPPLEDPGEAGIKVDQYEHVTLSKEMGEKVYYVKRGEHVDVPVPVFLALKERYPNL